VKPISIGAVTATVLAAGLILDEFWAASVPCTSDPIHCGELPYWDWSFRIAVMGLCCMVALVAGTVVWFAAAQVKRLRRRS
jgi:hypothetical protein